eukprot:10048093-Lingulodinium_polyedra.AAC.1
MKSTRRRCRGRRITCASLSALVDSSTGSNFKRGRAGGALRQPLDAVTRRGFCPLSLSLSPPSRSSLWGPSSAPPIALSFPP